MKNASLQLKSLVLVAGAMAIAAAAAVGGLYRHHQSLKDLERVVHQDIESQKLIHVASSTFKLQVQEWKNVLLRGWENASLEKYWAAFLKQEAEVATLVAKARSTSEDPQVREVLDRFTAAHREAGQRYRQGLETFKAGGREAQAGDKAVQGVDRAPSEMLTEAEALVEKRGDREVEAAVKRAEGVFYAAVAAILVTILATLGAVWVFMRRGVLNPIAEGVRAAEQIAAGDLSVRVQARSRDEAGILLDSLGRMTHALAALVSQVRSSAESVATAASQVATGTTDLSQRTEEQASSLEETAASMEELASTVRQNADNARQADELARSAFRRASQGGGEVVAAVGTMGEISASAKRIADIISVIDGIAFQTNILALNAAVEAARAGEQGRGFAVVASEVRSLAQRSAGAAKEIKDLIGGSVQKVERGSQLVEQAGETIQALVVDVQRVSELMGSIAEASAEQSRGVQQVNKTVTEMDKVVQQNAAAVQESASAAEAMRRQAESLVQAVAAFRVGGEERRAAPAARAAGSLPRAPRLAKAPAAAPAASVPSPRVPAMADASGDEWKEF